jgi:hypothetical protein
MQSLDQGATTLLVIFGDTYMVSQSSTNTNSPNFTHMGSHHNPSWLDKRFIGPILYTLHHVLKHLKSPFFCKALYARFEEPLPYIAGWLTLLEFDYWLPLKDKVALSNSIEFYYWLPFEDKQALYSLKSMLIRVKLDAVWITCSVAFGLGAMKASAD